MGIHVDVIRANVHLTGGDELRPGQLLGYQHAGFEQFTALAQVGGMHELAIHFDRPEQMRALARWAAEAAQEAERRQSAERFAAAAAAGDAR